MNIDAFSVLLAVIPLASYIAMIAAVRLSGRHLMTTSARDIMAMAVAASGLVAIGPAQLFFPNTAAMLFGPKVWLAMTLLYVLVIILITLLTRPSLVVYGRTPSEVHGPLAEACRRIDPASEEDPSTLEVNLNTLQLRLRCEGSGDHDATRIVSFAPAYGPQFWNRLLSELRSEKIEIAPGRTIGGGWAMVAACIGLAAAVAYGLATPQEVAADFKTWLWR